MTDNMYRRLDACSYDCARRHNEKTETALWLQHRYRTVNKAWLSDWEDLVQTLVEEGLLIPEFGDLSDVFGSRSFPTK
jgi:hypothetical protein